MRDEFDIEEFEEDELESRQAKGTAFPFASVPTKQSENPGKVRSYAVKEWTEIESCASVPLDASVASVEIAGPVDTDPLESATSSRTTNPDR